MRRAGRHQHAFAHQRAIGKMRLGSCDNLQRFRHAAGPIFATGHIAVIRADKTDAVAFQYGAVALGCRMLPHAHIHRRGHQHRRIGGQKQRRGQIAGQSLRHFRHQIGGARRHNDQISRTGQLDVAHLGLIGQVKQIAIDLLTRQCGDGQRCHKLLAGTGQYRCDRCAALGQPPDQIKRLIGSDSATDDQQYAFSSQHDASRLCFTGMSIGKAVAVCQWERFRAWRASPRNLKVRYFRNASHGSGRSTPGASRTASNAPTRTAPSSV